LETLLPATNRSLWPHAIAARAIFKPFCAVSRQDEVHQQLLAFSISHDEQSARIYGYYPGIDGEKANYYRHLTEINTQENWAAYQFTKNVYDIWMPDHFKRICSAIVQLPLNKSHGVDTRPKSASLS
jgi:hypothetical protein